VSKEQREPTDSSHVLRTPLAVSRLSPSSECAILMFHEQARGLASAPSVPGLDPRHWASSVLAGAWRPVTAATALEGSLLGQQLHRCGARPCSRAHPRRLVGLRPSALGVRIEWKRRRTTLIHHYGPRRSGVNPVLGTARQAVDLVLAAPGRGAVAAARGGR